MTVLVIIYHSLNFFFYILCTYIYIVFPHFSKLNRHLKGQVSLFLKANDTVTLVLLFSVVLRTVMEQTVLFSTIF